jgi:hypothetical protein
VSDSVIVGSLVRAGTWGRRLCLRWLYFFASISVEGFVYLSILVLVFFVSSYR